MKHYVSETSSALSLGKEGA